MEQAPVQLKEHILTKLKVFSSNLYFPKVHISWLTPGEIQENRMNTEGEMAGTLAVEGSPDLSPSGHPCFTQSRAARGVSMYLCCMLRGRVL